MFDTIVLLTGPLEETALAAVLRRYRPQLEIRGAKSLAELAAFDAATLARARLIAFVTPVVVPAPLLEEFRYSAYNFHPGPPSYPGWAPAHFAIYDGAAQFGATAHAMVEKVDAGPIVGVESFAVPPDISVLGLEQLAVVSLARIFWKLAPALTIQCEPLAELSVKWSGRKTTRRMHVEMCDIPSGISGDDLERRIKAFGGGDFGQTPAVRLHGHRFRYAGPEAETKIEAPSIVPAKQRAIEPA